MSLLKHLGGAFSHQPSELKSGLSPGASDLVKRAFDGIDPARLIDYHTHVVGTGAGGTGNFIHPKMQTLRHPFHRFKFNIYLSAAGIENLEHADREFIMRLADLARNIEHHGKYQLLAFDKNYNRDGTVNLEKTEFYVSNEYVFTLAEEFSDIFVPTISIHPYRRDALEELEKWARHDVPRAHMVKWLPNAMNIDPSDPVCDPFYEKMKELDLVLLSHGGEEKAVEAEEDQKLGNPLLLRRALDHGVKVVIAHCAGMGENEDLDDPQKPLVSNFDLFMRLMEDERYEGLVFGEISAMTQFNRAGAPLRTVLERRDLHARIINGSDYPLPAINALIWTRQLRRLGYITSRERSSLNEIYDYNPLLFDFALKRHLKAPRTNERLPASVFMMNPALPV